LLVLVVLVVLAMDMDLVFRVLLVAVLVVAL
jgi:hypothetical protein